MAHEKEFRPQRTKVDYFKKPHPLRVWRRRLSLLSAALAFAWVLYAAIAGRWSIFSPGPVTAAHSPFEAKCELCHTGSANAVFLRTVSDASCERCHAGPVHHPNQVFEGKGGGQSPCAFCHNEHTGRTARLRVMEDGFCTQCHKDLRIDSGTTTKKEKEPIPGLNPVHERLAKRPSAGYEPKIEGFASRHPEFRLISERFSDATPIKLNHAKHLRPELPGRGGKRVQMVCADCHRQDDRGQMIPPQFEAHCQSCHSLAFDPLIPEEAPHEEAEIASAFLRVALSKYAGNNPGEWKQDPDWHPARNLPSLRRLAAEAPKTLPEWVETRFTQARRTLFKVKCRECHTVEDAEGENPEIVAPEIPERWFVHSVFSHAPHQTLECVACHRDAPASEKTSDLLLPGRDRCVGCHSASNASISRCSTCHVYHPPGGDVTGARFKLEELLR